MFVNKSYLMIGYKKIDQLVISNSKFLNLTRELNIKRLINKLISVVSYLIFMEDQT